MTRPRLLFIAEQAVPPVQNGSTRVYKMWLDLLAQDFDLYAVMFAPPGSDCREAQAYLRGHCRDFLILPATPKSRWWKALRALGRGLRGTLFAPDWIENWGRTGILAEIDQFVTRNRIELCLASKLTSLSLIGRDISRRLAPGMMIDLHDDFVEREALERQVFQCLRKHYPDLRRYEPYRHLAARYRLSRFSPDAARVQETRMLDQAGLLLISSADEAARYRRNLHHVSATGGPRIEHLPWPIELQPKPRPRGVKPRHHAGFIASDAVFNLEAALFLLTSCLPKLRQRQPDFSLLIAGRLCTPLRLLGFDTTDAGVTLQGEIADPQEFYREIALALVPLQHGTGVSLKTLEALAYGVPILCTESGARGIAAETRAGITLVPDSAFPDAILALLADPPTALIDPPALLLGRQWAFRQRFLGLTAGLRPIPERNPAPGLALPQPGHEALS